MSRWSADLRRMVWSKMKMRDAPVLESNVSYGLISICDWCIIIRQEEQMDSEIYKRQ